MGTGRALKEKDPSIQVCAAEPDHPMHGLEGLKHMATAMVPSIYNPGAVDRTIPVPTERAYDAVGRLARTEGILAGPSGGAAIWASLELAREIRRGVIVTVLPDSGSRYVSTSLLDMAFGGG